MCGCHHKLHQILTSEATVQSLLNLSHLGMFPADIHKLAAVVVDNPNCSPAGSCQSCQQQHLDREGLCPLPKAG